DARADIVPRQRVVPVLGVRTDRADQSRAATLLERKHGKKIRPVQRGMQFAVHHRAARLDVRDVKEMIVGAAREIDPEALAAQRLTAATFRPPATTASARPIWRYSSSVRACTARARDVVPGSAVLSTIRTRTPSRVSQRASTRPVGPAPTTRTSVVDKLIQP